MCDSAVKIHQDWVKNFVSRACFFNWTMQSTEKSHQIYQNTRFSRKLTAWNHWCSPVHLRPAVTFFCCLHMWIIWIPGYATSHTYWGIKSVLLFPLHKMTDDLKEMNSSSYRLVAFSWLHRTILTTKTTNKVKKNTIRSQTKNTHKPTHLQITHITNEPWEICSNEITAWPWEKNKTSADPAVVELNFIWLIGAAWDTISILWL